MRQPGGSVSPMSNEGRNTYVVEHLTKALLDLLRDKTLEEISVRELCERAGVGRASFYRNFSRREDILTAYVADIFREWTDAHQRGEERSVSEQVRTLFAHFEAHRDFYELLSRRGLVYLLKDVILRSFALDPEAPMAEAYIKAYAAYSLYGWVETWFRRGMRESAEELAALFCFPSG